MTFTYKICKEIYLLGSRGCAFCVLPWQLCLCTLVKIKLWQALSERDGSCSKWLPVELKEHKGESSFFCSPFTRGEVHRVSVRLAPRSYQQLLVGKKIVFASLKSQAWAFLTSHWSCSGHLNSCWGARVIQQEQLVVISILGGRNLFCLLSRLWGEGSAHFNVSICLLCLQWWMALQGSSTCVMLSMPGSWWRNSSRH